LVEKKKKKEDYRSFLWPFSCMTLLVASLALKEQYGTKKTTHAAFFSALSSSPAATTHAFSPSSWDLHQLLQPSS
jgi:hypothetical protein